MANEVLLKIGMSTMAEASREGMESDANEIDGMWKAVAGQC